MTQLKLFTYLFRIFYCFIILSICSLEINAQTNIISKNNLRIEELLIKAKKLSENEKKDSAKIIYKKIIAISKQKRLIKIFAKASQELGILLYYDGKHGESLSLYLETVKFLEIGDHKREIAIIYNELATLYKKHKDYYLSEIYFQKALKYSQLLNDFEGIANASNNIGLVYEAKGDYKSSLNWYKKGLENNRKASSIVGEGYSLEFMGVVYSLMKENSMAEKYLLESLALRLNIGDQPALGYNYINLSEFYNNIHNYDKAIFYANESLKIAKKLSIKDLLQYDYELISSVYAQKNDFNKALTFHKKFSEVKDSLYSIQTSLQINTLKARFETEKKEQSIKTLEAENKVKTLTISRLNIISISLIILLFLLVMIAYLIYSKRKIKQERILQEERERISLELHDNVGSHLTYLISSVDFLTYKFRNQIEGLEEKLEAISSSTRDTMQQLRNTIWVLNPGNINLETFIERQRNYVLQRYSSFEIEWNIDLKKEILTKNLKADQTLQLFRIGQEALQNIEKHANATKIKFEIKEIKNNIIHFSIQDNGQGFVEKSNEIGHYGLENMRKRALKIDGNLLISSIEAKGTIIEVNFKI